MGPWTFLLFLFMYLILRQRTQYLGVKYGLVNETQTAAMTGGLVQEFEHSVFPSIKPLVTLVATALSILVRVTSFFLILTGLPPHTKQEI